MINPKTFTFLDLIILLLLLLFAISFHYKFSSNGSSEVQIFIDNNKYAKYDLLMDREVKINGKLGETTLKIENGYAELINSPCPHQICVKTGKIKNPANQIVCAPGHILIRIDSRKDKNKIDAIVQ